MTRALAPRAPFAAVAASAAAALLASTPARADPPADADAAALRAALARHGDADVAALRAAPPEDAARRCVLGVIYARRGDLPRAARYLPACDDATTLPADLGAVVALEVKAAARRLRASALVELQVITRPAGLAAVVDAMPDEVLTTPATVWVVAGRHEVRIVGDAAGVSGVTLATSEVTAQPHSRAVAYVDLGAAVAPPAAPRDGKIDMSDGEAGEATSGPPPDVKRGSLVPDRFTHKAEVIGGLEDPEAHLAAAPPPPWHLGVRLAGGVYASPASSARAGWAAAIVASLGVVEASLGWSRRGGGDGVGAIGLGIGARGGLDLGAVALAGRVGLRGEVRTEAMLAGATVPRLGLGVEAALEVTPRGWPLSLAVRVEQAVTELATGARDRALVLELGVPLR
jgi:hypothetical protein